MEKEFIYGVVASHESTIRPHTIIVVMHHADGHYSVQTRTAGVITWEEPALNETRARDRFERKVEEHYRE